MTMMHATPGFPGFDHVEGTEERICFACRTYNAEPLPEGRPIREAWVRRIMSRQANPDGAPMPSRRQSEREAPDWELPFIRRIAPQEAEKP